MDSSLKKLYAHLNYIKGIGFNPIPPPCYIFIFYNKQWLNYRYIYLSLKIKLLYWGRLNS